MLEGDKSMAIYFDCFEDVSDEFHDAIEFGVDYSPCFSSVHFDDNDLPLDEDVFLATLSDINLDQFPPENLFDVAEYIRHAYNINRTIAPKTAKSQDLNPKAIQSCLGYLPLDIIKRTLDCTTQLAKWHTKLPFKRHWLPRFPFLNVHRLSEPVATDTFFANCKALGGETCAQVFYGIKSHMINVYPMKTESEGSLAYEDFLREEGCPTILRRDNSQMQTSDLFTNICRHFCIGDGFTEPHHPHQNPAENHAVRWIKQHAQTVMNITGAPAYVWTDCVKWIVDCHNVTAHEAIDYRTPYEKRHGSTPDISAYVLFHFWERIYYHSPDNSFPESKELPGYFLGIAKNVGDALTFVILSQNGTRLCRSVIRSAVGKPLSGFPNARLQHATYDVGPGPAFSNPLENSMDDWGGYI